MNKYDRQVVPINVFSDNQLEEIHMGTLEVLRRTGLKITHPETVELLRKAGCWIDGERVRIPSHLIEWAIDSAPKRVVLCTRGGDPTIFWRYTGLIMDEVAGEVRFFLNGIKTDREQLAIEVIDRVGPGGEYVTSDHTLSHFREGWSPTKLGNRDTYENWVEKGGKTLGEKANERVKEILASHSPKPISDDIKAKVEAIIAATETKIGKKE